MAKVNFKSFSSLNQYEIWKPIVGYEGYYSISTLGRVRRDAPRSSNTGGTCKMGRILRAWITHNNVTQVSLSRRGKTKRYSVHRLVAAAFLGPCPEDHEVNHKDGNRTNNCLANLEYVTPQENKNHAKENGLYAYGERNASKLYPERLMRGEQVNTAKLTADQVIAIRKDNRFMRIIAEEYGVSLDNIKKIKRRIYWKHIP